MFSSKHRLVIYPDGIARETMHFIAGLLGDQQVYFSVYLCYLVKFGLLFYLVYLFVVFITYVTYQTYRKGINSLLNLLPLAIAARQPNNSFLQLIVL